MPIQSVAENPAGSLRMVGGLPKRDPFPCDEAPCPQVLLYMKKEVLPRDIDLLW